MSQSKAEQTAREHVTALLAVNKAAESRLEENAALNKEVKAQIRINCSTIDRLSKQYKIDQGQNNAG